MTTESPDVLAFATISTELDYVSTWSFKPLRCAGTDSVSIVEAGDACVEGPGVLETTSL